MDTRYTDMHEILRHINHESENLKAAARTLKVMMESHVERCGNPRSIGDRQVENRLRFYASFLENLQLRALAFEERLRNEILLVKSSFR